MYNGVHYTKYSKIIFVYVLCTLYKIIAKWIGHTYTKNNHFKVYNSGTSLVVQ